MTKQSNRILTLALLMLALSGYFGLSYAQKFKTRSHSRLVNAVCEDNKKREGKNLPIMLNICKEAKFNMSEDSPVTEGKVQFTKIAFLLSLTASALCILFVTFREKRPD